MRIPDGYRYVNPEENLEQICKALMADVTVTEVKLFLKAGESISWEDRLILERVSIL